MMTKHEMLVSLENIHRIVENQLDIPGMPNRFKFVLKEIHDNTASILDRAMKDVRNHDVINCSILRCSDCSNIKELLIG